MPHGGISSLLRICTVATRTTSYTNTSGLAPKKLARQDGRLVKTGEASMYGGCVKNQCKT